MTGHRRCALINRGDTDNNEKCTDKHPCGDPLAQHDNPGNGGDYRGYVQHHRGGGCTKALNIIEREQKCAKRAHQGCVKQGYVSLTGHFFQIQPDNEE